MIEKVGDSRGSYQNTHAHMLYAVECMAPTIFNWSEGLLVRLKDQLTKCWRGELKKFSYEEVVVSFFLEWVPLMWLQVPLNRLDVNHPRML